MRPNYLSSRNFFSTTSTMLFKAKWPCKCSSAWTVESWLVYHSSKPIRRQYFWSCRKLFWNSTSSLSQLGTKVVTLKRAGLLTSDQGRQAVRLPKQHTDSLSHDLGSGLVDGLLCFWFRMYYGTHCGFFSSTKKNIFFLCWFVCPGRFDNPDYNYDSLCWFVGNPDHNNCN